MIDNDCLHQLIAVANYVERFNPELENLRYVMMVCAYCGQARKVYADGTIVIEREQGEVIRPGNHGKKPSITIEAPGTEK